MLTEQDCKNLKSAVRSAVKLAGGQENAANVTSRIDRPATLSDYGNPKMMDRWARVDVAVEIDEFNGEPLIVAQMAEMLGYKLVSLPRRETSEATFGVLHRSIKEAGEAIAAIIEVEGYGGRPKGDARANGIQQIEEAIEALLEAKERLVRMGDE